MKKLLLTTAITVAVSLFGAQARLGESANQCIDRYGEPQSVSESRAIEFRVNDFKVICSFNEENICDFFSVEKKDTRGRNVEMTDNEISIIQQSSSSNWVERELSSAGRSWCTEPGEEALSFYLFGKDVLIIETKDGYERMSKNLKNDEEKNLSDF